MAVMKKPAGQGLKAWSFSVYSMYQQCPRKVKFIKILRLQEPTNEPMQRGDRIHKLAEQFVKGEIGGSTRKAGTPKVPDELQLFADELRALRLLYKQYSHSMVVEDTWAFTRDWEETAWNDWAGCWLRVKLDVAYHEDDETLVVVDWKTGKFRPEKNEEYVEQQELYALAALLLHDHIKVVKPRLKYTDLGLTYGDGKTEGEAGPLNFTRADIPRLKKTWEKRVKAMMADTRFSPKPNNLCRFCHFRKENGGPCQY